jgi:hypothetical protein
VEEQQSLSAAIAKAKSRTFGPSGKRFTPCPYGCRPIKERNFEKHIKNVHGDKPIKIKRRGKVVRTKGTDALLRSISGGRPESNRRKH